MVYTIKGARKSLNRTAHRSSYSAERAACSGFRAWLELHQHDLVRPGRINSARWAQLVWDYLRTINAPPLVKLTQARFLLYILGVPCYLDTDELAAEARRGDGD